MILRCGSLISSNFRETSALPRAGLQAAAGGDILIYLVDLRLAQAHVQRCDCGAEVILREHAVAAPVENRERLQPVETPRRELLSYAAQERLDAIHRRGGR